MARRAPVRQGRHMAWVAVALLLCAGVASAQTGPASAPARSAAAAPPPGAGSARAVVPATAPAVSPAASRAATPAAAAGASTGSSGTPAPAPNANNQPLSKPTDSTETAVAAQLLLVGPDAWPFGEDRQAKLVAALKQDLMWSTGRFPDPLKYVVTEVIPDTNAGAGRKLLQETATRVRVQIDTGSTDLVGNVRSNLVRDVENGAILRGCKAQGLALTRVEVVSALYTTPEKPKPDNRPQMAAGITVAACIILAFIVFLIYLEAEKTRTCCGYSWGKPVMDGKPVHSAKPGTRGGLRGFFNRKKAETVAAGDGVTDAKASAYNFDDPPAGTAEVAMQPQNGAAVPVSTTPGIGRNRLP